MIEQTLTLPCGHSVANRLCKAAMTEGLANAHDQPTHAHQRLYTTWARGGAAILLTGNIMVDRRYLERAGNVVAANCGRGSATPGGSARVWSAGRRWRRLKCS